MIWLIIGVAILFVLINSFNKKRKEEETKPIICEIQKTSTLNDIVASINYGRVYPYYIGMSFTEVKDSVLMLYRYADAVEFNKTLQFYEKTAGVEPFICLPNRNPYIKNIYLDFNKNNVVSSITIAIKDFREHASQLKELMCAKFGAHTPSDGRYITWSDMRMVILIDEIDGCIEVVYLKIC